MSSVLGKVYLESCETHRSSDGNGGTAAHVKFKAAQSDGWSKYTPNGSIEMYINNPAAAKVFIDAWRKYTETPGNEYPAAPMFYVRFTPADEVDSGKVEA